MTLWRHQRDAARHVVALCPRDWIQQAAHVVAATREYLISAALQDETTPLPTYGDVAALYGGIARAVGPVLNSIARECDQEGQPDLTALVVDKGTAMPGSFDGHIVQPGSSNEFAWRAELYRIRSHDWRP